MKHYYCNPLNVDYLYQFNQQGMGQQMGPVQISREAADPSMIYFKGEILHLRVHDAGRLGVRGPGSLGE